MEQVIEFTLTVEDVGEMMRHRSRALQGFPELARKEGVRKTVWSIVGWGVILGIGVMVFLAYHQYPHVGGRGGVLAPLMRMETWEEVIRKSFLYVLAGVMIFLLGVEFRRRSGPTLTARQIWEASPELQQPQKVRIGEEGIAIEKPTVEMRATWGHFVHFYESTNLFFLISSGRVMQPIAKRAFGGEGALAAFREMCQSRVMRTAGAFPVMSASGAGVENRTLG